MEMEEMQNACKMSRISSNKIGLLGGGGVARNNYQDDNNGGGDDAEKIESNRLRAWHSSRIFRVSRASGGKDRHSKVLTAKGLRDRRVRLSVSTAIQFYDLQDRLGYDQPSKAVEWLINAAADAISELPSLESRFPDTTTKQGLSDDDEKRICISKARFDTELLENNDPAAGFQQQQQLMSKSACSSTSETSKGSVLSLSRTEIRVKARERARERAAKDKDKEQQIDDSPGGGGQQNSHSASFTELLNSGGGGGNNHSSPSQSAQQAANFFFKQARHSSPPMDCFHGGGMYGGQTPSSSRNNFSGFSTQFGISPSTHTMTLPPSFTLTSEQPHHHHHHQHPHHNELQQFSFLPDHLIPDAPQPISVVSGNDYNLNFSIAGYNRGTLQSNSPSSLPPPQHLQRFADGSNMPFYVGNPTNAENHHVPAGFDGRLQLYYGDGSRHSDTKGKDHKR